MSTPPDTIVGGAAFWLAEAAEDATRARLPCDGYPAHVGHACLHVTWVDDHMFGGSTTGSRYLVDRRKVENWEQMSLPRLPREVRASEICRKVPVHYRALYGRDGADSYFLRGPFVRDWGKR